MIENILPKSGKMAIIDDKLSEVEGLLEVLSQRALPFVCLGSVPEDYCNSVETCFRVVFLDLIFGSTQDAKTVKSIIYSYLTNLISDNNGPYVLAIWSTKQDRYKKQIEDVVKELPNKPEKVIYLNKSKYAEYKPELFDELQHDLGEAFDTCDLLNFTSAWENAVNSSAFKTIADFDMQMKHERDVNKFTSCLANLVLGQMAEHTLDNEQRLMAAYDGINALLSKNAAMDIYSLVKLVKDKLTIKQVKVAIAPQNINTLLWIAPAYKYHAPKNVYKIDKLPSGREKVFSKCKDFGDGYIYMLIDITNKCYFAQNKISRFGHHLVQAILVPNEKWNKDEKNDCILNIGEIVYCEKCYRLVVLLNEVIHMSDDDAILREAIFSVSDEVYNEVRAGLGYFYTKSGKQEL